LCGLQSCALQSEDVTVTLQVPLFPALSYTVYVFDALTPDSPVGLPVLHPLPASLQVTVVVTPDVVPVLVFATVHVGEVESTHSLLTKEYPVLQDFILQLLLTVLSLFQTAISHSFTFALFEHSISQTDLPSTVFVSPELQASQLVAPYIPWLDFFIQEIQLV
jgi:hypothetical protein